MVFTRNTGEEMTSFLQNLDKLVAERKSQKLGAVIHLIGGKTKAETKKKAEEYGKQLKLKKVSIVVPRDFENGPKNWKFSNQAEVTIFTYSKKKVVSSYAFQLPGKNKNSKFTKETSKAILAEIDSKLLGIKK